MLWRWAPLFFLCCSIFAQPVPDLKSLATHPQWLRLVHYKKKMLGGYESEADGLGFFVSPNGKYDPQAELEATLKGFSDTQPRTIAHSQAPPQSVRCQFPARFRWLSDQLHLSESEFPVQTCADFEVFKNRMRAKSITFVFSAYYLNNPSSAFGHSLLRLNRSEFGQASSPLLNYGINFAANQTSSNPILYALYGLSGVFPGTFAGLPYYYKVREYNDFESRDLWEYDLNLTKAEIDQLLAHIWELGSTYFDYFYLTENCSYHMLTLLEAAAPRLHVTQYLPLWVIPADTLRALERQPGLIGHVQLRPSARTQFYERVKTLSPPLIQALQTGLKKKSWAHLSGVSKEDQALVLDAAIDAVDYKSAKALQDEKSAEQKYKQELLTARSRLPTLPPLKIEWAPTDSPDNGHDSARFGLAGFHNSQLGGGAEVSMRFALHDFLDPSAGYPPFAQLEFLNLKARYFDHPRTIELQEVHIIGVDSISPWTRFERPLSWRLNIGAERIFDHRCRNCLAASTNVGVGMAYTIFDKPLLTPYVLALASGYGSSGFERGFFSGTLGVEGGARLQITSRLLFLQQVQWLTDNHRIISGLRWSFVKSWAIDAHYQRSDFEEQSSFGMFHYF